MTLRMTAAGVEPARRVGRPKALVLTVGEVAKLLELDERLVRARCRLSFFSGAVEDPSFEGGWRIPQRAVEAVVRTKLQPFFSIERAAREVLDVGYSTLYRETAAVSSLSDPLPVGKRVRALLLFLGEGKGMKRIPESELQRLLGGARRA